ncbi:MAG TPA: FAD-binding oxidoreductase [Steroidobacteraceae bacterium]|jgi:glycine/D-amino acid oxidase-like deaminating enzyme|nr:FAD-binding oxidoreductase [Steroidobacteraceae bacterium]
MHEQGAVAVIGAGVIGSAVAYALARENRSVLLIDRAEPGMGGASYGNAGHIAAELIEPFPSPQLLFGFWRELFALNGPLDIPMRHWPKFAPWAARFAAAAFRRRENAAQLAALVKPACATLARWLQELGRPQLLQRNGHYEIWLHRHAQRRAHAQAQAMQRLSVSTAPAPAALLAAARTAAGAAHAGGLWFSDSAHVIDPLEIVRTFAAGAAARGVRIRRAEVSAVRARAGRVEVDAGEQSVVVDAAVVCAGAWSASLLAPLGLSVPLESVRGYHVELPEQPPLIDAPIAYSREEVIVTPMAGRLRATSYMEFLPPGAPADPRKPARLRKNLRALGYRCELAGPSWVGARPVLPDYLPGIGRVPGTAICYAIGHHHVGLTLAALTADLVADLVAQRPPRLPLGAFDLQRF